MNAVRREQHYEVEVANIETTDAKLDALRDGLNEVRQDVRELRGDVKALRGEMHSGFAAVREEMRAGFTAVRSEMHSELTAVRSEMRTEFASIGKNLAALQATMNTWFKVVSVCATLALIFFSAGKALHWFESTARPDASITYPSTPSPPAIAPRAAPAKMPR